MPELTEAACLLGTGSMYPSRVGMRGPEGGDVFLGIKPGGFSIYFGDAPIFHFDGEGRWQRAYIEGVHYLKGLDASVRSIDREREGSALVLRRRVLEPTEVEALDEVVRSAVLELSRAAGRPSFAFLRAPESVRTIESGEFQDHLSRVVRWDARAWQNHRHQAESTYASPWPFLPPDYPNPLVLQATHGRGFGHRRVSSPTRVRSVPEFAHHVRSVATLLGRGISQRRGIFVTGPDLLRQPQDRVLGYLQTIQAEFADVLGPYRIDPIHAWLDDFGPPLPDLDGWRRLRAARLGRVTLGIESGCRKIRELYGKSWLEKDLRETVSHLKTTGIGVGVVVLLGPGGSSFVEEHVETTAGLIASLDLDRSNLVSMVDARKLEERVEGPDSLSQEEMADQARRLKERLAGSGSSNRPRVVAYNPEKQWA